jgi:hypothetical protein
MKALFEGFRNTSTSLVVLVLLPVLLIIMPDGLPFVHAICNGFGTPSSVYSTMGNCGTAPDITMTSVTVSTSSCALTVRFQGHVNGTSCSFDDDRKCYNPTTGAEGCVNVAQVGPMTNLDFDRTETLRCDGGALSLMKVWLSRAGGTCNDCQPFEFAVVTASTTPCFN